jgi:LysR family glycine cleavage system transcriptional activator
MKSNRRRLPLTALRTLEAAARLESFKDAAVELGVSATTVSNQIRMLERDWRCLLFVRKTRQVVLTETGQSLSKVVRQAFDAISREIDFHVSTSRQSVTIAVGAIFGARWLTPRLIKMRRDLPRIDLSLHRGRRVTGPSDMPAAIVVDWGTGDWPGLHAEQLLSIQYSPVISPSLVDERGKLDTPADLSKFPVIHQHDRAEWSNWLEMVGAANFRSSEETIIEDSNIAIQAALAGQGVTLGTFPLVQDEVDSGRLVKPFAQNLSPDRSYYILTRPGARNRPEIAAVCDWLLREANLYAKTYPFTKAGSREQTARSRKSRRKR